MKTDRVYLVTDTDQADAEAAGPREPPHCPTCGCGLPAPTTAP